MPILRGKRVGDSTYTEGGRPYPIGRPRWTTKCTCERKRRDYSSFFYIVEEYRCYYPQMWGQEVQHKAKSLWSTIVCSKCNGRAKVLWDPRDKGIKGILWAEYTEIKKEPQ